jgi:hypothetical protein
MDTLIQNMDLRKILEEDELYKGICAALPEDQRHKVQEFVMKYVESLQSGAWEPLLKMFNDKEFVEALYTIVEQKKVTTS